MLSGPFCVSGVGWFVSGGLSGGIIVAAKEFPQPPKTVKGGELRLSPFSGLFADGKITPYGLLHNAVGVLLIIRPADRIPAPAGQANIITNNGAYEWARFFLPNGPKFDIIFLVPPIFRKE